MDTPSTQDPSPLIGSDSWTSGSRYTTPPFKRRLAYFFSSSSSYNESALTATVSKLRGGTSCSISEKFSAGNFNVVKKITFDDGVEWVARLRLPPIEDFEDLVVVEEDHETFGSENEKASTWRAQEKGYRPTLTERDVYAINSEIATMHFVHQNTTIPLPQIHAHSHFPLPSNPVGCPYILLSYIHVFTAFDLALSSGLNPLSSIPAEYFEKYTRQLAGYMVQLASLRSQKIGSLIDDGEGGWEVGKIADTGTGPYSTTEEFYKDYPKALAIALYGDSWETRSGSVKTVTAFPSLSYISAATPKEPSYGLLNLEMGSNNILITPQYDIVGIIDWDSVISVPRACLHSFPWCGGADPGIPGVASKIFGEWEGRREMTRRFAEIVGDEARRAEDEAVETAKAVGGKMALLTREEFFSREALAFRALEYLRVRQTWVDSEWFEGLVWMEDKSEDGVRALYVV